MILLAVSSVLAGAAAAQNQPFVTKENAPPPFGTPAQEQGMIANVCGTQFAALGEAGCACLAERAMTALDDPQREYLILSVVQPPAADRMATARSPGDLKRIATFLDAAGKDCAAPAAIPEPVPDDAPKSDVPAQ